MAKEYRGVILIMAAIFCSKGKLGTLFVNTGHLFAHLACCFLLARWPKHVEKKEMVQKGICCKGLGDVLGDAARMGSLPL